MAAELLIRVYDVGLGDCILCRLPGAAQVGGSSVDFHMLIDCGSLTGMQPLQAALNDLAAVLPDTDGGMKRLDLLVITHEHRDHIAGLDPALFARFKIGAIWMNAAMDPNHPQASRTQKLHAVAAQAMRGLVATGRPLGPALASLVDVVGIDNIGAMRALRTGLPKANGIEPKYVHAGQSNVDLGLPLVGAVIRVLGPEQDIDRFYLGKTGTTVGALAIARGPEATESPASPVDTAMEQPVNMGRAAFQQLRARMLSTALAFADLSGHVRNNSSVILLVEWQGRRLLFVGDAEWDHGFKEGKSNGSWNVMWAKRRKLLAAPVDFLKIGHHGSENATPWNQTGELSEPAMILDAILPLPPDGREPSAVAVASTRRANYPTIPKAQLLNEIGRRVRNVSDYDARLRAADRDPADLPHFSEFERDFLTVPQPQRTDLERILTGKGFVDVKLTPAIQAVRPRPRGSHGPG